MAHLKGRHRETHRKAIDLERLNDTFVQQTIIIKIQMLILTAWWQLLMEMLQMRPSNNE